MDLNDAAFIFELKQRVETLEKTVAQVVREQRAKKQAPAPADDELPDLAVPEPPKPK